MLLDFLGLSKSADAVKKAVASVLKAGRQRTPDLGGVATTTQMSEAVRAAV
jgi:tartrate dehydrogenase/decarboxylase/D-malate dehydrogenase